jgi:hypothetical protein
MPCRARKNLRTRLNDVDEIVTAHIVLTGGGVGRPSFHKGAALTRAGVVLLTAALEAYVEDLFEESVKLIMPTRSNEEYSELFERTSKRLNVADVYNTNFLFFNLGIPWVLDCIRWQKFSNRSFRKTLNKLVDTRNKIAHGSQPRVRLAALKKWRGFVMKYSEKLEEALSTHITQVTNTAPNW